MKKNTHGGSRGGGRPQKPESEKKTKNVSFRPSAAVAEILGALEKKKRTDFIEKAILHYKQFKQQKNGLN